MKRAFTLIEILCVIAIIAALAAILFPVFARAKEAAQKGVSTSNLHQLQVATTLYQMDWNGDGRYGTSHEMGLPLNPGLNQSLPLFEKLVPPRAPHLATPILGKRYYPLWTSSAVDLITPTWKDYALAEQGASILFVDPFFNTSSVPLYASDYVERFFIAVRLDGAVVRRKGYGDWLIRSWWAERN